jgi:hypothetical protein
VGLQTEPRPELLQAGVGQHRDNQGQGALYGVPFWLQK